jgi:hypothetical protein
MPPPAPEMSAYACVRGHHGGIRVYPLIGRPLYLQRADSTEVE